MSNRGLSSYKYILVYKFANLWRAKKTVDMLGIANYNTFFLASCTLLYYSVSYVIYISTKQT